MKISLHVGLHKTGTSYLQKLFFENSSYLESQGVLYPATPGHAHHKFAACFKNGNLSQAAEIFDQFVNEARCKNLDRMLISSEVFSEIGTAKDVYDALYGYDVEILLYLREPVGLFLSAYNQLVREPSVRRSKPINDGNIYNLDYLSHFNRWRDAFPKSNIWVFNYDVEKSKPAGILGAFCERLGVRSDGFRDSSVADGGVNKSIGVLGTEVLRQLNQFKCDNQTFEKAIDELSRNKFLDDSLPPSSLLKEDRIKYLIDVYLPILNHVLEEGGQDLLSEAYLEKKYLEDHRFVENLANLSMQYFMCLLFSIIPNKR